MKKLLSFFAGLIVTVISLNAQVGQVYVNGYTRSNGTYVQGHYRTAPNTTKNDNWTTIGNVNPYTGSVGTLPGGNNSSYCSTPSYSTPNFYSSGSSYTSSSLYSSPVIITSSYSTPTYYSSYSSSYSSNSYITTTSYTIYSRY